MLPRQCKNIIFDLGAVIINLETERTRSAFKRWLGLQFSDVWGKATKSGLFEAYETGTIDSNQFRGFFFEAIGEEVDNERFDLAWNAMLLDIPSTRIDLLIELKKHYRLFLLSNTNEIHMKRIHHYLDAVYGLKDFTRIFEQVVLSYKVGKRKPDPGIFELVLSENNLVPEESLFIDDTEEHVLSARGLGLMNYHLQAPQTVEQLFQP